MTNIDRITTAIATCPDPLGANHAYVMFETGIGSDMVSYAFQYLMRLRRVFSLGRAKDSRYYTSAERMEAARPAFEARLAVLTAERAARQRDNKSRISKARLAERAQRKAAKAAAPKPAKPKPKPGVDAPVTISRTKAPKWSDMPAIRPASVKVQKVSGCPAVTRYEPEPGHVGEFSRAGIGRYVDQVA